MCIPCHIGLVPAFCYRYCHQAVHSGTVSSVDQCQFQLCFFQIFHILFQLCCIKAQHADLGIFCITQAGYFFTKQSISLCISCCFCHSAYTQVLISGIIFLFLIFPGSHVTVLCRNCCHSLIKSCINGNFNAHLCGSAPLIHSGKCDLFCTNLAG